MKTKVFYIFLFIAVGLPLSVLLLIPTFVVEPETIAFDNAVDEKEGLLDSARSGRIKDGAIAYGVNGCYVCHTQLIRPTYNENSTELWRDDWAGRVDEDGLDTRRETMPSDYYREPFAQVGLTRRGPDLSNFGYRAEAQAKAEGISAEALLYRHFWDPAAEIGFRKSVCPSQKHLFVKKDFYGQDSEAVVPVESAEGTVILPKEDMKALVSYLISLKRDYEVPAVYNFTPKK